MECISCGKEIGNNKICAFCGTDNGSQEKEALAKQVNLAKDGDTEAQGTLISFVYKSAYPIARSICGNASDTEDVLQNASIKILKNLSSLDNPYAFESWAKKIVRNEAYDFIDKAYKQHDLMFTDMEDQEEGLLYDPKDERITSQPDLMMSEQARKEIIEEVLNTLSDDQRIVTMLYFFEDMTMKEISEELGIKESTVIGRLSTAKKNIKSSVEQIQKKDDIRLYNLTPLSFFVYLLRLWKTDVSNEAYQTLQGVPAESLDIVQKAATKASSKTGGKAASTAENVRTLTDNGQKIAEGTGAGTAAAYGASQAVAAAGSTAAGFHISKFAVLGIILLLAVGGAGAAVYMNQQNKTGSVPETTENPSELTVQDMHPEGEPTETAEPDPAAELVWINEDTYAFEGTKGIYGSLDFYYPWENYMVDGYPQEFTENPFFEGIYSVSYTPDSLLVSLPDGTKTFYSYEGEQLRDPFHENVLNTPIGYVLSNTADVSELYSQPSLYLLSPDFRGGAMTDQKWPFHGEYERYTAVNGKLYLYYQLQGFFEPVSDTGQNRILAMKADSLNAGNGIRYTGQAVCDRQGNVVSYAPGVCVGVYANGYYPVIASDDFNSDYEKLSGSHGQKAAFVNGETGELITEYLYDDYQWFQGGYCPVKRDGKWTYINKDGKEISGLLFDDASVVYAGKAYVKYDGAYRLIDLNKTESRHLEGTETSISNTDTAPEPGNSEQSSNVIESEQADQYLSLVSKNYHAFYLSYLDAIAHGTIGQLDHVSEEFRNVLYSRYSNSNKGMIFNNVYIHLDQDSYNVTKRSDSEIEAEFVVDILNTYTGNSNGQAEVTMRVRMNCGSDRDDWKIVSSDVLNKTEITGHSMLDITNAD